ncbi:TPR repeat-containing protein C19B12.01 [Smittium mucronatum]|uniref:TPR repeat-containing protein C19B12.01 n=1 Tax=Smittium mucronatum TaxID=133383 RepID=A0A1R0H904_9FUNG|nr:TPR repeat-containing protein C19B12.01 [Smittium mucronatum]
MNFEYLVITGKQPKAVELDLIEPESQNIFEILSKTHPSDLLKSEYAKTLFGFHEDQVSQELPMLGDGSDPNFMEFKTKYSRFILSRIALTFERYGQEQGWRIITALGIACLNLFLQINYTGPNIDFDSASLLPKPWSALFSLSNKENSTEFLDKSDVNSSIHQDSNTQNIPSKIFERSSNPRVKFDDFILSNLQVSGEQAYTLVSNPLLLYLALFMLTRTVREFRVPHSQSLPSDLDFWLSLPVDDDLFKSRDSASFSARWWELRALRISQEILDNPSGDLLTALEHGFSQLSTFISDNLPNSLESLGISASDAKQLTIRFSLEYGMMFQYYHKNTEAKEWLEKSQSESGLVWKLTGAKGKRTKFQENNIAQLLVLAKSSPDNIDDLFDDKTSQVSSDIKPTPKNLNLDDDTLLEKTEYLKIDDSEADTDDFGIDPLNQENLRMIDQCILLGFCLEVKNENPSHGLTTEQMVPFVTRVIENPNNWSIYTASLLIRSRLEADKSRTVQRSALQLQALVDQADQPLENEADSSERLTYFFQLALPSIWDLKKELANRLMSIGAIRSALDIFESLMMWDETVSCYQILEQSHIAEKLVRQRLESHPNDPKVLCILGDLKQSPQYWKRSWEASNRRYTRAMRALGGYYFKNSKMDECIEAYQMALRLNPLFEGSWYNMGCAALHIENWTIAIEAFQRVVQLDNENAEAWNNLASVYLRLGDKKLEAWNCLKEAIKFKFDNWQIWSNFLVTSVSIGRFASAIQAMGRIIELRVAKDGSKCVDVEILNIIIQSVTRGQETPAKVSEFRSVQRSGRLNVLVENLLVNVIAEKITDSPEIWRATADFWFWKKDYVSCLDCYEKAYRCASLPPQVCYEVEMFKTAMHYLTELVDMYESLGPMPVPIATPSSHISSPTGSNEASLTKPACPNYKLKSKMAVQGLINKARDHFENTPEFESLESLFQRVLEMN